MEHFCKTCCKQCSCIYKLTKHIDLVHPERAKRPKFKTCEECGEKYTTNHSDHLKSRKHVLSNPLNKTTSINISGTRAEYHHVLLEDNTRIEFHRCCICDKDLSTENISRHWETKDHIKNEDIFLRSNIPLIIVSECPVSIAPFRNRNQTTPTSTPNKPTPTHARF